jgi:hypothetical protein
MKCSRASTWRIRRRRSIEIPIDLRLQKGGDNSGFAPRQPPPASAIDGRRLRKRRDYGAACTSRPGLGRVWSAPRQPAPARASQRLTVTSVTSRASSMSRVYRGCRLGQQLARAVIAAATRRFQRLWVGTESPEALRLYQRLGFQLVASVADCAHTAQLIGAEPVAPTNLPLD